MITTGNARLLLGRRYTCPGSSLAAPESPSSPWGVQKVTSPVHSYCSFMPLRAALRGVNTGIRRALRVVARPVRRKGYEKGVVMHPYRGYGTPDELFLMGRVFRQPRFGTRLDDTTVLKDIVDILRRIGRLGLGKTTLTARFGGSEQQVVTDRDGYFRVEIPLRDPPPRDRLWHEVELEVTHRGDTVQDVAPVFVPPEQARYVVISDIDDTVMLTGVANVAKMMYRLFVQGAESRVAFPGVAAFYRALHRGASGEEKNPMLYVSRGPWSIYEVLEEFFNLHDIPHGPILFLREWGLTLQRPLPKRATEHKQERIEEMLARYESLPFILIGDSGQHDPETYARVVRDFPGRVLAVYIRNVSQDESRRTEIEDLAQEIARQGSTLILAGDTYVMANHAADDGYISRDDLVDLVAEKVQEEDAPPPEEPLPAPPEAVHDVLENVSDELQPDVVVEAEEKRA